MEYGKTGMIGVDTSGGRWVLIYDFLKLNYQLCKYIPLINTNGKNEVTRKQVIQLWKKVGIIPHQTKKYKYGQGAQEEQL